MAPAADERHPDAARRWLRRIERRRRRERERSGGKAFLMTALVALAFLAALLSATS